MQLFSTRYRSEDFFSKLAKIQKGSDSTRFLSINLRERLAVLVKDLVTTYCVEEFLLTQVQETGEVRLNLVRLDEFSLRELGYRLSYTISHSCELIIDNDYHDKYLLDILEIFIIFSKDVEQTTYRINRILKEEGAPFIVQNDAVTLAQEYGGPAHLITISDSEIDQKYKTLEALQKEEHAYEEKARVAADILIYIFSSPKSQKHTKKYSKGLCNALVKEIVGEENSELEVLIGEYVTLMKKFNNTIYNIRHTDKHTIKVKNPVFYKFTATSTLSIIDAVLSLLKSDFLTQRTASDLKKDYIDAYAITNEIEKVSNVQESESDVDPEDIPF